MIPRNHEPQQKDRVPVQTLDTSYCPFQCRCKLLLQTKTTINQRDAALKEGTKRMETGNDRLRQKEGEMSLEREHVSRYSLAIQ